MFFLTVLTLQPPNESEELSKTFLTALTKLQKYDNIYDMDNDMPVPQFDEEAEKRFRELVLRDEVATVTHIRKEMSPILDKYDDILLIRKILHILA